MFFLLVFQNLSVFLVIEEGISRWKKVRNYGFSLAHLFAHLAGSWIYNATSLAFLYLPPRKGTDIAYRTTNKKNSALSFFSYLQLLSFSPSNNRIEERKWSVGITHPLMRPLPPYYVAAFTRARKPASRTNWSRVFKLAPAPQPRNNTKTFPFWLRASQKEKMARVKQLDELALVVYDHIVAWPSAQIYLGSLAAL